MACVVTLFVGAKTYKILQAVFEFSVGDTNSPMAARELFKRGVTGGGINKL